MEIQEKKNNNEKNERWSKKIIKTRIKKRKIPGKRNPETLIRINLKKKINKKRETMSGAKIN